jgi:hypothetical protein
MGNPQKFSDRSDAARRKLGRRARKKIMRRKILAREAEATTTSILTNKISTLDKVDSHGQVGNNDFKQIVSSCTASDTSNRVPPVPTDRSYQQESCQKLSKLTESDRIALTRQLGYLPGNVLEVVARVKDAFIQESSCESNTQCVMEETESFNMNDPLVIKLYPLVLREETDGSKSKRKRKRSSDDHVKHMNHPKSLLLEPFPTIFWVTHPRIKALISKLELDGMGRYCEQLLKSSTPRKENGSNICEATHFSFNQHSGRSIYGATSSYDWQNSQEPPIASMTRAHVAYGKERQELLSKEDWAYVQQRKWDQAFSVGRGVAGMSNFATVKCLHAHVAHFWSGCHDNLIGQWVAEHIVRAMKGMMPSSSV